MLTSHYKPDNQNNPLLDDSNYVRLDIRASALKRLINDNNLRVEELHCQTRKSRTLVRQMLIESLSVSSH